MKPFRFPTVALLFAMPLAAVLAAQAPALDVRMGLWEVTATTTIGGQMPSMTGMDMSSMTPEQQARMAEAMKGMMGAHTTTSKSCLTREEFDKSSLLGMNDEEKDADCRQTITTNTRTTLEGSVTCKGAQEMSGRVHIEAASPTAFSGTFNSSSGASGQAMTFGVTMAGKWLGADCGDVK
jgi:hypothetical protein